MNLEVELHTTRPLCSAHARSTHAFLASNAQKHFLCTMVGPDSSYSPFEIHICWKVLSEDMMDRKVVSWTPLASLPTKLGWKSTSGQRKRSEPTVMMLPSGSSYVFSLSELSPASFISVSKSKAM